MIKAVKELHQNGSAVHLVLAGPIEDFALEDVLKTTGASRYLTYLGEVDAPERILNACDVLCLISEREGLGRS